MIDRRHRPGGHWLDSYPFVQLHQPSMNYGVNSTPLGRDRVEPDGRDAGFYERASGTEICGYYDEIMRHRFAGVGPGAVLPDVRLPRRPAIPIAVDRRGDGRVGATPRRRRHVHGVARSGHRPAAVRQSPTASRASRSVRSRACTKPPAGYVIIGARQDGDGRRVLVARSGQCRRTTSRGSVPATRGS